MAVTFNTISSMLGLNYGSFLGSNAPSAYSSTTTSATSPFGNSATVSLSGSYTTAIRSYSQAMSSANEGVSKIQLAQNGLSQISSNMSRLKDLATQASSTTITQADRDKLQAQAVTIQKQNDQIIAGTKYGSESLLASKHTDTVQTGVSSTNVGTISFSDYSKAFAKVDLSTQQGAASAVTTLANNVTAADKGFDALNKSRTTLESSLTQMSNATNALTQAQASSLNVANQVRYGGYALGPQSTINPLRALGLLA
ncbi:MAG: hypothetical protein HQL66_04925 [Magnetococcales bacterium]|nr:hypothetical protein [Magnetococcales bacterium]